MLPELLSIETPAENVCVFWFDGPAPYITSVSAVYRENCCLVIDSYCGSDYMDAVRQELQNRFSPQQFILLNTHHHWDHVWGNASFADCDIISTSLCRKNISDLWQEQLDENRSFFRGREEMILPNVTIDIPKEILPNLFAIPAPGHTADSLSLWDKKNRILFAGDLVEFPVVQLCESNLSEYRQTLAHLIDLKPNFAISGHCRDYSPEILEHTASYLEALAAGKNCCFEDKTAQETHLANLQLLR